MFDWLVLLFYYVFLLFSSGLDEVGFLTWICTWTFSWSMDTEFNEETDLMLSQVSEESFEERPIPDQSKLTLRQSV